jgi:hypothetical protein
VDLEGGFAMLDKSLGKFAIVIVALVGIWAARVDAGATYEFNNTLAAQEAGAPALVAVDPLAQNGFLTENVLGTNRPVYHWSGNNSPVNEQAGLLLNTTGVIADPTLYSVEMIFKFTEDTGSWRSIMNTRGRMEDTAFYVEPGDRLQVYNDVTGTSIFSTGEYHYIALTVANNTVKAYFDGNLELNSPTDKLNIIDPTIAFFLDNNLGGPAETEFADGSIALLRIHDFLLTD